MMHTFKQIALVTALLAPAGATAFAATGDTSTDSGQANAAVLSPITLVHATGGQLQFGTIFAGTGGTIVVDPSGAGTATAGAELMPGTVTGSDAFQVHGEPGVSYAITTGGGTVTSGADTMTFTTTPSAATATLSTTGDDSFTVGGVVTVPATTNPGSYAGSYPVTVDYN